MTNEPVDLNTIRALIATAAGPEAPPEHSPDPRGDAAWELALHIAPALVVEVERLRADNTRLRECGSVLANTLLSVGQMTTDA